MERPVFEQKKDGTSMPGSDDDFSVFKKIVVYGTFVYVADSAGKEDYP
jgi:hypothetical protein